MSELKELIEQASRIAEKAMKHKKTVPMFIIAENAAGQQLMQGLSNEDKDLTAVLVRCLLELFAATRYVLVCEAWQAELPDAQDPAFVIALELARQNRLRDHPDVIEVVMFSAEDDHGLVGATRRIVRGHKYFPTLGPLRIDRRPKESMGRMVGLLPRRADQAVN